MWEVIVDALKAIFGFLWSFLVGVGHALLELMFSALDAIIPESYLETFYGYLGGWNIFLPIEPLRDALFGVLGIWAGVQVVQWLLKIVRGA